MFNSEVDAKFNLNINAFNNNTTNFGRKMSFSSESEAKASGGRIAGSNWPVRTI